MRLGVPAAIPEPGPIALAGLALGLLGGPAAVRRLRARRRAA